MAAFDGLSKKGEQGWSVRNKYFGKIMTAIISNGMQNRIYLFLNWKVIFSHGKISKFIGISLFDSSDRLARMPGKATLRSLS